MNFILVYKGNNLLKTYNMISEKVISIGRHSLNNIHLPDPSCKISRFHAAVFFDAEGNYLLQDLGTRNNTYINGKKRDYGNLNEGDRICIGDYTIVFQRHLNKNQLKKSENIFIEEDLEENMKTIFSPVSLQWKEIEPLKNDPEGLLLLYKMSRINSLNLDIEEFSQLIIKDIFEVFHPDRIFIAYIEQQGEALTFLARLPEESEIKVSRTMIRYLLEKKQVLITENALADKRFKRKGKVAKSIQSLQIKAAISMPLLWDTEIKGILYMDSLEQKRLFTERDLKLLTLIGNDISSFMEKGYKYRILRDEKIRLENRLETKNTIIGISLKAKEILKDIERLSNIDATVLITGETGTGKDLIAEAIHQNSKRKGKPFIEVNCAAIPNNLLESELFGVIADYPGFHNKESLKGKFELANDGTIFLNEVGELPLRLQSKLLEILEKRRISPLGAKQPISIDIRIIAATNRDLQYEIQKGHFREDLYERLNIFPIHLPPLRERKEDIPLLASYFLYRMRNRIGKTICRFSNSCIELLSNYEWPRNIRELKNAIERAIIRADRSIITPELFDIKNEKSIKPKRLKDIEKEHIMKVLDFVKGNKEKARNILGISKQTLYNKGREYNLPGFEVEKLSNS